MTEQMTRPASRIRWHGGSDAGTSPRAIFMHTDQTGLHAEELRKQFDAVVEKLRALHAVKDHYHYPVVQLICENTVGPNVVFFAFRFTSDWAANEYNDSIFELSPSLGRGCFRPFQQDSGDYDFFFRRNDEPAKVQQVAIAPTPDVLKKWCVVIRDIKEFVYDGIEAIEEHEARDQADRLFAVDGGMTNDYIEVSARITT